MAKSETSRRTLATQWHGRPARKFGSRARRPCHYCAAPAPNPGARPKTRGSPAPAESLGFFGEDDWSFISGNSGRRIQQDGEAAPGFAVATYYLCLFAFMAGFVDSVVGGGGLIQLPALLILLPPTPANSL